MVKKKIGIVGATGFTGSELVRILLHHDEVEISVITSESRKGELFSDVHPFFKGIVDMPLSPAEEVGEHQLDLVFLALPHGISMEFVERFKNEKFKIIDLSGDFRLPSPELYEEWYGKPHSFHAGFEEAVFGLPELNKDDIQSASLVANPGCYPTSAILALAPLIKNNLIQSDTIIIDSKSGITGAGVKAKSVNHFSNVNDNFKAYGLKNHRHTIEIQETLNRSSKNATRIQFTPHLLPVDRGILTTSYTTPLQPITEVDLQKYYQEFYKHAPFIRWRSDLPDIKSVRGTNLCDVYATYDDRTNRVITISTIDNLVKGAAGQAVQNMNIMLGLKETSALELVPLKP